MGTLPTDLSADLAYAIDQLSLNRPGARDNCWHGNQTHPAALHLHTGVIAGSSFIKLVRTTQNPHHETSTF